MTLRHGSGSVSECDDLVRIVSPHVDAVWVERVWAAGGVVRIAACTRELTVACPDCGRGAARVHSRYRRTLADVAVGGRPVLIGLSVRRLFCDSPGCGRRTFAEQVEGLTARYQRRSPLLQHLVEMAGVLLASRGGARLMQILKVPLSRTSVLFHLMRLPLPPTATPRVLGVDDFALYADVYGTLLVDADTRLRTELWAGRDAEQLAAWLRTHPGVEVRHSVIAQDAVDALAARRSAATAEDGTDYFADPERLHAETFYLAAREGQLHCIHDALGRLAYPAGFPRDPPGELARVAAAQTQRRVIEAFDTIDRAARVLDGQIGYLNQQPATAAEADLLTTARSALEQLADVATPLDQGAIARRVEQAMSARLSETSWRSPSPGEREPRIGAQSALTQQPGTPGIRP
ncbi:transposase family protein [Streptomyces sp. NPDC016566]|uniref:transposase family protein n=1 Tax=Streptomyces sp. NPDC016566 TaxID=3364967 RepID=UPI0036F82155